MSRQYLIIVALGMVFYFINPVFTAIFNGLGNSKTPFRINTVGLITNIILDPILILDGDLLQNLVLQELLLQLYLLR